MQKRRPKQLTKLWIFIKNSDGTIEMGQVTSPKPSKRPKARVWANWYKRWKWWNKVACWAVIRLCVAIATSANKRIAYLGSQAGGWIFYIAYLPTFHELLPRFLVEYLYVCRSKEQCAREDHKLDYDDQEYFGIVWKSCANENTERRDWTKDKKLIENPSRLDLLLNTSK